MEIGTQNWVVGIVIPMLQCNFTIMDIVTIVPVALGANSEGAPLEILPYVHPLELINRYILCYGDQTIICQTKIKFLSNIKLR